MFSSNQQPVGLSKSPFPLLLSIIKRRFWHTQIVSSTISKWKLTHEAYLKRALEEIAPEARALQSFVGPTHLPCTICFPLPHFDSTFIIIGNRIVRWGDPVQTRRTIFTQIWEINACLSAYILFNIFTFFFLDYFLMEWD